VTFPSDILSVELIARIGPAGPSRSVRWHSSAACCRSLVRPIGSTVPGGATPAWPRDGKELFFLLGRQLHAVAVAPGPPLKVGVPRPVFNLPENTMFAAPPWRGYNVSADGKHFLTTRTRPRPPEPPLTEIQLTFNWREELRSKVPVK